jgi:hypothetical protein
MGMRRGALAPMYIGMAAAVAIGLPAVCRAEPGTKARDSEVLRELRTLKNQVSEMNRQMKQLQAEHAVEIDALKEQIRELRAQRQGAAAPEKTEASELAALRRLAKEECMGAAEEKQKEPAFRAGWLSLQSLNPEISVTGDMIGLYTRQKDSRRRWDTLFRCLGLHFESYLDPYTRFKAAVPIHEDGAELGEAYMTRFGVLKDMNLTLGKFRQQFGVVNRWHKHGLDQVDFPLALRQIFGNGGLNQTGISLDWRLPKLWGASQELTLQIAEGTNDRLFGGNTHGTPSILGHYKSFRDLTKDTYFEWGATVLVGWNDEWLLLTPGGPVNVYDSLCTRVFGLDWSLLWEPTGQMRHRNVEWRGELYLLNRDILAPDGSGRDALNAWGAYSYIQAKLSREWDIGLRVDYFQPDSKGYAVPASGLAPLAVSGSGACRWQIGPYITWHQSPFVKYRLEYNHVDGSGMGDPEDVVMLQVIFAAGPHKHERY